MEANNLKAINKVQEEAENQGDSVEEICLDQIHFQRFNSDLSNKIENYKKDLHFLSLNDCGLTSLEGFPVLPSLARIELTDNKINGSNLAHLSTCKELKSVSLGGNPLKEYSELEGLKELPELIQLDLFGCPISNKSDYTKAIFAMFPSLKVLDNMDQDGNEVEYDEDEEDDDDEEGDEEGDDDEDLIDDEDDVDVDYDEDVDGEGEGDEDEDGEEDDEDEDDGDVITKKVKKE